MSDGKISYIEVKDGSKVVSSNSVVSAPATLAKDATIKVKVAGVETSYTLGEGSVYSLVYKDNVSSTYNQTDLTNAEFVKLSLDKDGKVVGIIAYELGSVPAAIVKDADATRQKINVKQTLANSFSFNLGKDDTTTKYVVIRNGKISSLSEIKENDIVYNFGSINEVSHYIVVVAETITGKLTGAEYSGNNISKVTVDGKGYYIAKPTGTVNGYYSENNGEDINGTFTKTASEKFFDKNVTLYKDFTGRIALVAADITASDSAWKYAIIKERIPNAVTSEGTSKFLRLTLTDGTTASYKVTDDSADTAKTAVEGPEYDYAFVKFTLDSDGAIDDFEVVKLYTDATETLDDVDVDNSRISVESSWYVVNSNTVVMKVYNDNSEKKPNVISYATLRDYLKSNDVEAFVVKDGGLVKYIVIPGDDAISTDYMYAVVTGFGYNKDGYTLSVYNNGTTSTYNIKGNSDLSATLAKKDLVKYTVVDGKINSPVKYGAVDTTVTDIDKANKLIKVGTTWYTITSESVIYDTTNDDPEVITLDNVVKDDVVKFLVDEDGKIKALVIKN